MVADADDDTLRGLAAALATEVNPGLLSQVDTYTWRSPEVMLSTAQDWRPGQRGEQDHIWQATVDPDALVFTQHPRDGVPSADDPNANEGYWTGDAAMPRSAQVGNVSISIYAPQYAGGDGVGSGAYSFSYEPYTHAFFPTEQQPQSGSESAVLQCDTGEDANTRDECRMAGAQVVLDNLQALAIEKCSFCD